MRADDAKCTLPWLAKHQPRHAGLFREADALLRAGRTGPLHTPASPHRFSPPAPGLSQRLDQAYGGSRGPVLAQCPSLPS